MPTNECPTCGNKHRGERFLNDAMDADVPFKGKVSKEVQYQTTVGGGWWYCGPCPDTWHDSIAECPVKGCKIDGLHKHEFVGRD